MKKVYFVLFTAIFLFMAINAYTDEYQKEASIFLPGFYLKAKELLNSSIENITQLEKEIEQNRDTIKRSEKIILIAGRREDQKAREVENAAREALITATDALKKNEETLKEWQKKKERAEKALLHIKNMANANHGSGQRPGGFVSNIEGTAETVKPDGERVYLNGDSPVFFEQGDKIVTHKDGSLEMQFLDGRGRARLMPDTQIVFAENSSVKQDLLIIKGRFYGVIDKVDDYLNKIKKGIKDYQEDLKTIDSYFSDDDIKKRVVGQLYINLLSPFNIYGKGAKYVQDPKTGQITNYFGVTAVCAVRGTIFAIENREDGSGEVSVTEGILEITPRDGETFSLEEGFSVSFKDNKFSEPFKIENLNRWWENE
jgi:hypothetical protein